MKQVIVVNKSLNMSPGKLAAMVAHGSIAFLTHWFSDNVDTESFTENNGFYMLPSAEIDRDIFINWISGSFTKIILEAEDEKQMEEIVGKAHSCGMINNKDFFNIVDDSTEFESVPKWAVIAFKPYDASVINQVTGKLNLYGHQPNS